MLLLSSQCGLPSIVIIKAEVQIKVTSGENVKNVFVDVNYSGGSVA